MAGRGGKPGTWQSWEHPPPGQGAVDSALFCPDSRCKHRIFPCSSPRRPTWKTKSFVCSRGSQSSRALGYPTGALSALLCIPSWRNHEGMELLCGLVYTRCARTRLCLQQTASQSILGTISLLQDLLTIQIMVTIKRVHMESSWKEFCWGYPQTQKPHPHLQTVVDWESRRSN